MAVERINMHLGERERAIADLMRSRNSEIKVEELAARLAELEQGGGGGRRGAGRAAKGDAPLGGNADMHAELRELAHAARGAPRRRRRPTGTRC